LTTVAVLSLVSVVFAYQDLENGIQLYNARKFVDAERVLSLVVEAEGENAKAHEYLGLTRLSLGKLDPADAEMSRAQELDPGSDSIKVGIARIAIEKKQFDRAEESLNAAKEINGESAD